MPAIVTIVHKDGTQEHDVTCAESFANTLIRIVERDDTVMVAFIAGYTS